ncbi:LytR/AlgR family response regulator transcription factor [Clostridium isatidis]|uniref:Stage 0 sporulation protein A homolog n=1 Tax=Clostridium isatidis TaxID=182773 RepID=A0A343JDY0_9CLOT|nr:LytTR family DNA-binding domain-containing protein [Clostridium isatidis]ASW43738.1 hypothetical protein BEN51_09660 [Clostridium isatidis]
MPLLSGIDIAKEIRNIDKITNIIFLTSSPEFALASYSVRANNYLLKPFTATELFRILDDVAEIIINSQKYIIVKGIDATYKVFLREIEYLEAQNKYLIINLSNGSNLKTKEPLYSFSNKLLLEDGFYKCHRSFLINLNKIKSFTSKDIKMQSGAIVPIARSVSKVFVDIYFSFSFKN